jgi:hypothetical protein
VAVPFVSFISCLKTVTFAKAPDLLLMRKMGTMPKFEDYDAMA